MKGHHIYIILGILSVLILGALFISNDGLGNTTQQLNLNPNDNRLGLYDTTAHYILGNITYFGKEIIGSEVTIYINERPNERLNMISTDGEYIFNLKNLSWWTRELAVVEVNYGSLVGFSSIELDKNTTQPINVELAESGCMVAGSSHIIKISPLVESITPNRVTLSLEKEPNALIEDKSNKTDYYFDVGMLNKQWCFGDNVKIGFYNNDQLIKERTIIIESTDIQEEVLWA